MEDSHIIQLFFDRAERAIEALSVKYGKLCYRIAYNILTNHRDAEECENDTYLRVWDTVPPIWPDNLRAYVSRIVRNLALDRVRYQSRQKRSITTESFLSELSECVPAAVSVEADADDTVVQAVLFHRNFGTMENGMRHLVGLRQNCRESVCIREHCIVKNCRVRPRPS